MSYHDIRILFLCLVIQKVLNILFCSDLLQSVCKHLHEHFIVHLLKQGLFCIFVKNLFIHCFQGRWVPRNPVALDQCVACTVYNMVFWFTADLKVVLGTRNECVFHAVFQGDAWHLWNKCVWLMRCMYMGTISILPQNSSGLERVKVVSDRSALEWIKKKHLSYRIEWDSLHRAKIAEFF